MFGHGISWEIRQVSILLFAQVPKATDAISVKTTVVTLPHGLWWTTTGDPNQQPPQIK